MNKNTVLVQSLVDYVNDVKPYHTKFREVTSQIFLNDSFNVGIKEDHSWSLFFQNVWTRDDIGGYTLYNLSEGSEIDRTIYLPPTIFSRFSLNDSLNYGQSPLGDDPATLDLTDINALGDFDNFGFSNNPYDIPGVGNGISDSEEPWTGDRTASHQRESDQIPVAAEVLSFELNPYLIVTIDYSIIPIYSFDTSALHITVNNIPYLGVYSQNGNKIFLPEFSSPTSIHNIQVLFLKTRRFAVPYHHGSRVHVNGNLKTFGVDYVVDHTRT